MARITLLVIVLYFLPKQASHLYAQLRPSNQLAVGTTNNQPLILMTNAAERIRVSSSGMVGIGNSSPSSVLDVTGNADISGAIAAGDVATPGSHYVEGAGFFPALLGQKTVSSAASSAYRSIGVLGHVSASGKIENRMLGGAFFATTASTNNENLFQLRALQGWVTHNGTGTITNVWGSYLVVTNKSTGIMTNAYGTVAGIENASSGTINKAHALSIETWNNRGGRIDTLFGATISVYNSNAASSIGAVYGLSVGRGMISNTGGTHFWRNNGVINNSYGIYLDPSIDVGINKYALYSLSKSNSLFSGHLEIANQDNLAREIRFFEPNSNGSNFSAFKAGTQSSDITYQLPVSPPLEGQVLSATGPNATNLEWNYASMLPLRINNIQRDALVSPLVGIIIFNTDLNKHQAWDGTVWHNLY
jgi:hypothetical protein